MTRDLARFLSDLFTPSELDAEVLTLLGQVPGGAGLRDALPDPASVAALLWFTSAVGALDRRGLISSDGLFAALLKVRPGRAREIREMALELRKPAPDRQVIDEDSDGVVLNLRCLSWRLFRPIRWRLDLPVYVLLERVKPRDGFEMPVQMSRDIYGRLQVHLEHAGQRLDPTLSLGVQAVEAGVELVVCLELTVDAPHQAPQTILLRGEEEDGLEALLAALGFRLAV